MFSIFPQAHVRDLLDRFFGIVLESKVGPNLFVENLFRSHGRSALGQADAKLLGHFFSLANRDRIGRTEAFFFSFAAEHIPKYERAGSTANNKI